MKGFTKRSLCLVLALVLCTSMIFGGCAKKSNKIDKDGNVMLEFWSIYPEGGANYDWLMGTIAKFEESHPGIKVHYTGISFWDYFTKITTSMTDPTGPDVYIQTIKDTNDRARGAVSMNLTPFFDDSFNAGEDYFYEADVKPMTYEGNVYGLPYILDNRVLYYNIDIVNQLKDTTDADWTDTKAAKKDGSTITGKPADLIGEDGNVRAPKTWDELQAYQQLLTLSESGKITQLGFDVNIGNCKIENSVFTHGGNFFDAEGNPTITTDPGVRAGFETWYDLTHTLSQAKVNAFVDTAGDNTANLFWSGLVGMMIATNEIPWQNDALGDKAINLGAAPVPYDGIEENHYNFTGGFSMELSNRLSKDDKKVQQAAFEFLKYLCSPDVQREILSETSNMPAHKEVYEELLANTTDPAKRVVMNEMDHRKAYDYIFDAPNWFGQVQDGLIEYISDKKDLDKTLEGIQNAIMQLKATY